MRGQQLLRLLLVLSCNNTRWQGPWHTRQVQAESKSTEATFLTHLHNNQLRIKHKSQHKAALSPSFLLLIWAVWGPGLFQAPVLAASFHISTRSLDWFGLLVLGDRLHPFFGDSLLSPWWYSTAWLEALSHTFRHTLEWQRTSRMETISGFNFPLFWVSRHGYVTDLGI